MIYEKFIVFFELDLYSKPISINSNHDFSTLFCELILKESLGLLTWSKKAIDLKNRVNFINENLDDIDLPNFEEEALLNSIEDWLKPYLQDIKTIKQLESLDIYSILLGSIPWESQQLLDLLAPTHIKVPSGSNIKIDYSNSKTPVLAVKIQEMFGMSETPLIFK